MITPKLINKIIFLWVIINILLFPLAIASSSSSNPNYDLTESNINTPIIDRIGEFGKVTSLNNVNTQSVQSPEKNILHHLKGYFSIIWYFLVLCSFFFYFTAKNKKKKAVLFTLGLTFVSITLLSFAVLIYKHAESSKTRLSELGFSERLYNLDLSIQRSFADIFLQSSGISIGISGLTININETIPNNMNATIYLALDNFVNYTESNNDFTSINTSVFLPNAEINIMPHNISYHHLPFGGNIIRIVPLNSSMLDVSSYNIYFNTGSSNVSSPLNCDKNTGNFMLNLYGSDNQGNSFSCLNNVSDSSSFDFTFSTLNGSVVFELMPDYNLTIENTDPVIVSIQSYIGLEEIPNSSIRILYPPDMITYNFTNLDVIKSSAPLIYKN
ncbi:MAG: hypothetical protein V1740_00770 [Candidatus Woesearchaeota archaeon]